VQLVLSKRKPKKSLAGWILLGGRDFFEAKQITIKKPDPIQIGPGDVSGDVMVANNSGIHALNSSSLVFFEIVFAEKGFYFSAVNRSAPSA
jgi:hypothetical protein